MSRRRLLSLAVLAAMLLPGSSLAAPRVDDAPAKPAVTAPANLPDKPSVVLLLIDDMAEVGPGIFERLPTMRRLFLEGGLRFTRMVGNTPLCCPGRATFLTGQRTRDHGVVENRAVLFDPRVSLATELKARGYRTGLFGKYFNGIEKLDDKTPDGWDRVFTGGGYFNETWWEEGRPYAIGSRDADYSTDTIRRKVSAWIGNQPARAPVFLYLSPYAVHHDKDENGRYSGNGIPVPAPRHRGDARCADIGAWQTPAHTDTDEGDLPAYMRRLNLDRYADGWSLVKACEALLSVDELLAAVENRLAASGRTNVLYVLVADNGMGWGKHGWSLKSTPHALPLPFMVSWPAAGLAGAPRVVDASVTTTDIAPTICAIAGCAMGPFPNGRPVAGRSLVPILTGAKATLGRAAFPTELLAADHWPGHTTTPVWRGVWTTEDSPLGRWSYVRYSTGEVELYDIGNDPYMTVNLADDPAYDEVRGSLFSIWRGFHR